MKGTFQRIDINGAPTLLPADAETERALFKMPKEKDLAGEVRASRNPKFLRYAMKIFSLLHEMSDEDGAFTPWRHWMIIQAGFFKQTFFKDGSFQIDHDSMAYESMAEERFKEVFRAIHRKFIEIYGQDFTYDQMCQWAEMR